MTVLPPSSAAFRRLSHLLRGMTAVCALASVAFGVLRWVGLAQGQPALWAMSLLPTPALQAGIRAPAAVEGPWLGLGLALECVPLLAMLYVVWCMHRICAAFLGGAVFSDAVIRGFRALAWGFVGLFVAALVYSAGVTALLSWLASGRHGGLVAVAVGPFEASMLVVGVMMFLLSHVMAEGQRLQAETEAFV